MHNAYNMSSALCLRVAAIHVRCMIYTSAHIRVAAIHVRCMIYTGAHIIVH